VVFKLAQTVVSGVESKAFTGSSLLGVGRGEGNEAAGGYERRREVWHGERARKNPRPLTPALAWRSSRIPAELYPPASNSIVGALTLAVKRQIPGVRGVRPRRLDDLVV